MRFLGIYRETRFSPGRVRDDADVMDATLRELGGLGHEVQAADPETMGTTVPDVHCVLTMAQSARVLGVLENWKSRGIRIVNPVPAIRNCNRAATVRLLGRAGLPLPRSEIVPVQSAEQTLSLPSSREWWLKRGDAHSVQPNDVVKVRSRRELKDGLAHFRNHGIPEIVVQDHVEGQVIKFYGVSDGGATLGSYFTAFRGAELEEMRTDLSQLRVLAALAAEAVGLEVYGGDAVITSAGGVVLIDLNAWPSFSRCRNRAARSIAGYVASGEESFRLSKSWSL